jgi:predicted HicB family RNase H-like nuclease
MINVMNINGYQAVIAFDPEIDLFRGEFVGLNGGADFYAADVPGLHAEGEKSLQVFLDVCKEQGIEPRKDFSGKVLLRLPPDIHAASTVAAQAAGKSLNQWALEALERAASGAGLAA